MNANFSSRTGISRRIWFSILAAVCLFGPQVQANFIATIQDSGTNLVVTGSGSIDLTGLSVASSGGARPVIEPSTGRLGIGSLNLDPVFFYAGFIGPASFGSGGLRFPADSGSGDKVGIDNEIGFLFVPFGYTSGAFLSSTSTFNNTSLSSLGIIPGIYTWTWGTGTNADSFNIYAGVPVPNGSVPEAGSSLMLMLIPAGLMFVATFRSRRLISLQ